MEIPTVRKRTNLTPRARSYSCTTGQRPSSNRFGDSCRAHSASAMLGDLQHSLAEGLAGLGRGPERAASCQVLYGQVAAESSVGDPANPRWILTKYGVGYTFRADEARSSS